MASFFYVYLLESVSDPDRHYVGFTEDLKERLRNIMPAQRRTLPSTSRGGSKRMLGSPIETRHWILNDT